MMCHSPKAQGTYNEEQNYEKNVQIWPRAANGHVCDRPLCLVIANCIKGEPQHPDTTEM